MNRLSIRTLKSSALALALGAASFGAFAGGLDVRDPAIAGLFPVPPLTALLGRDKVHAVAFDRLS